MQDRIEQPPTALVDRLREEFPELLAVYRFGSSGTGYERPDSDLDLAVYAGTPQPVVKLWRLAQELAAEVGRDDGIVDFNWDRCIGCNACVQACPYDALYTDPQTSTTAKCNYCAHRVDVGLEPACVNVCPEHAIISGDMDDPTTEISRLLARSKVTTRKPEKGRILGTVMNNTKAGSRGGYYSASYTYGQ